MRILNVAEEKEKSFYHKQYQQKFQHLKSKYKPRRKTENPPGVLDGYSGVKWSDKDLSIGCSNNSLKTSLNAELGPKEAPPTGLYGGPKPGSYDPSGL